MGKIPKRNKNWRVRARSKVTGRFVSLAFAANHRREVKIEKW
jgi:hypothetical protein